MKYRLLGACAAAFCCAAPAFAQGLTRVETTALQQQLRDDGCGVTHVTGHMDATTRAAVKKCGSKYNGATDAKSMLAAMNIGFGNGTPDPSLSMARAGEGGSMSAGGMSGSGSGSMNGSNGSSMNGSSNGSMNNRTGRSRRGMNGAMRDSTGMHGSMHDSTGRMMNGMHDNNGRMMNRMHDSTGRMMNGMRDTTGRMMNDSARRRMMRRGGMRDSTRRDTSGTMGSGGMVDMNKATPMNPTSNPATNPVPPSTNPRNSSTMGQNSSTMNPNGTAKHDTMPKPI